VPKHVWGSKASFGLRLLTFYHTLPRLSYHAMPAKTPLSAFRIPLGSQTFEQARCVEILDQLVLPHTVRYETVSTIVEAFDAIKSMKVSLASHAPLYVSSHVVDRSVEHQQLLLSLRWVLQLSCCPSSPAAPPLPSPSTHYPQLRLSSPLSSNERLTSSRRARQQSTFSKPSRGLRQRDTWRSRRGARENSWRGGWWMCRSRCGVRTGRGTSGLETTVRSGFSRSWSERGALRRARRSAC
jgi:hypothetical protein